MRNSTALYPCGVFGKPLAFGLPMLHDEVTGLIAGGARMSSALWRYLLTLAAIFALFIAFVDLFARDRFPDAGFTYTTVGERQAIVNEVFTGSAAASGGVKAGDRLDAAWFRFEHATGTGS